MVAVAIHEGDLQHVDRRIGDHAALLDACRQRHASGHELPVAGLDHPHAVAGRRVPDPEVVRGLPTRLEPVGRRRGPAGPGRDAVGRGEATGDEHATHAQAFEVVHLDEVGAVARLQQADRQRIVPHGIDARRLEHVEEAAAAGERPPHEHVHVPDGQPVGMEVVAREHAHVGALVDQAREGVEVSRGRSLTDEDPHAEAELFPCLDEAHALVVGGDAGGDVGLERGAAESGRVAIHRLAAGRGRGDLREHVGIARDDARVVHHLGERADGGPVEQSGHVRGADRRPGPVEPRGGHARRCAEVERERGAAGIVEHEVHARNAEDVGDLVGIGDGGHGAVRHRHAGELVGRQERALDVHVGVDEPRQEPGVVGGRIPRDRGDTAAGYGQRGGADAARDRIDEIAREPKRPAAVVNCRVHDGNVATARAPSHETVRRDVEARDAPTCPAARSAQLPSGWS